MSDVVHDAEARGKRAHMANQIAAYFRAYGEAEAVAGVAEHIERFWTKAMRQALKADVAAGAEGLDPIVVEAAAVVRG